MNDIKLSQHIHSHLRDVLTMISCNRYLTI